MNKLDLIIGNVKDIIHTFDTYDNLFSHVTRIGLPQKDFNIVMRELREFYLDREGAKK